MNLFYDVYNAFVKASTGQDVQAKAAALEKASTFLESLEPRLAKCKWLVGDQICMVDFWVGAFSCDVVTNANNGEQMKGFAALLEKCPNYKRYIRDFRAENAAWLRERAAKTV